MARNKYLEAQGVARLRWQRGSPRTDEGPVIVEVWRGNLYAGAYVNSPHVSVSAQTELWVYKNAAWHRLNWDGSLSPAVLSDERTDVRRWARMSARTWRRNITLDGWAKED